MQELDVILIGGPPGAGKTTLGRAVAGRLGFTATTVDDLVITGRVLTTQETHPALHRIRPGDHVRYFTESAPELLIADALEIQDIMWPAIQRVILSHLNAKAPTVLDWWLFDPGKVSELADSRVASVWLHIDPEVLERRERAFTEFRAGSPDPERMHSNFMHRSLWRNEFVASQAERLDLPVLHQSGKQTIEDLVDAALEAIG